METSNGFPKNIESESSTPEQNDPPVDTAVNLVGDRNDSLETTPDQPAMELPKYIHLAMEQVAKNQGFNAGQFLLDFQPGSSNGDGFVGELFKATLTEGGRRKDFLCKVPPLNEARREQYPVMEIFARETLAYSKFLPLAFSYQEEKGIGREDGFFSVPNCFLAECDEVAEESVIVMEDLRLAGYRMWDKLVPVNYEHARLVMDQLGRLHAVSLALKRDRPQELAQFKELEPFKELAGADSSFVVMLRKMTLDAMDTLEPQETLERTKLQSMHDNMMQNIELFSDGAQAEPFTVVAHGDCWVNNFMFQYVNGTPKNIMLLDWQCLRYVSPVIDLVYFIFCCTDEEFRRCHYDEMMSIYYHSMATLLEKLGHNPQEVFPRTALMRQLRKFGSFGLMMAAFLIPLMSNEELPDMNETAEKFREEQLVDLTVFTKNTNQTAYRKRMSAVIRDAVRYGYV
ncbi:uncharacterized protein LOC131271907 [Anopheles coustani]|uniref:uncharacterized protein LOC131271907 n=1 Tax=Anopheles coustani TaxID=139045 RepID=UPI002657FC1B|nr:uncharacterized protein LOC131271907 [Anopheles coustani]